MSRGLIYPDPACSKQPSLGFTMQSLEANSSYVVANVNRLEKIQHLCTRPPPGAICEMVSEQTSPSSVSLVNLALTYQIAYFTNLRWIKGTHLPFPFIKLVS